MVEASALYTRIQEQILEKIGEFGSTVTLRTKDRSGATYDPASDTYTGGSSTEYSVSGLAVSFDRRSVDGSLVKATDKRLFIPAQDTPDLDSAEIVEVDQGGRTWKVMSVKTVMPGDARLVYELHLR